jgi:cytochrome bd-type quinol oxidase subunit 2
MDNNVSTLSKKILVIASIIVPLVIFVMVGVGLTGLGALNPGNQTFQYNIVNDEHALFIQRVSIYAVIPIAIVALAMTVLNLKLARRSLNRVSMIACAFLVCWTLFALWATSGHYVSETNNSNQTLQIRTIN